MKQDSTTTQVTSAINDGWMRAGSFASSLIAGTLLGYFLDRWLGTEPWLVLVGILVGAYAGFLRIWEYIKELNEADQRDR